jgi:hypothetical protein
MEEPCHHPRPSLPNYPSLLKNPWIGIKSALQPRTFVLYVPTEWYPHLSIDQVTGALRVLARAHALWSALVGLLARPAPLLTA